MRPCWRVSWSSWVPTSKPRRTGRPKPKDPIRVHQSKRCPIARLWCWPNRLTVHGVAWVWPSTLRVSRSKIATARRATSTSATSMPTRARRSSSRTSSADCSVARTRRNRPRTAFTSNSRAPTRWSLYATRTEPFRKTPRPSASWPFCSRTWRSIEVGAGVQPPPCSRFFVVQPALRDPVAQGFFFVWRHRFQQRLRACQGTFVGQLTHERAGLDRRHLAIDVQLFLAVHHARAAIEHQAPHRRNRLVVGQQVVARNEVGIIGQVGEPLAQEARREFAIALQLAYCL